MLRVFPKGLKMREGFFKKTWGWKEIFSLSIAQMLKIPDLQKTSRLKYNFQSSDEEERQENIFLISK